MIKQGMLDIESLAVNAYTAWRLALADSQYEPGKFSGQPEKVQYAWGSCAQQIGKLLSEELLFDRKWDQIASMFYERLREFGGIDYCSNAFDDAPTEVRLAAEASVRHVVNCFMAENGQRLEDLLSQLIQEWLPNAESKVGLQPIASGEPS